MKIGVFVQSSCGGAERMSVRFSKILSKQNELTIHSVGKEDLLESFVGYVKSVFHRGDSAITGFIGKARKIIKQEKPDLIFCSLMPLNWRLALASIGAGCKIIFRSDNYIDTQSFTSKVRLYFAYKIADVVIGEWRKC